MPTTEKIIQIVEKIAKPIVESNHLDLVDVEFVKEGDNWFLRVIIDKEGGIDIDDCGRISEKISKKLDELDPIDASYFLEVCSPGAERPLKTREDIEEAIGEYVHIKTNQEIDGAFDFEGELLAFADEMVGIKDGKQRVTIPYHLIAKIRLAIKF